MPDGSRAASITRKRLLVCVILAAQPGVAWQLSIPPQSAAPGGMAVSAIGLASGGASISALQFDLDYDSSSLSLAVTPGDSLRTAVKGIYTLDLSNKKRIVLTGLNTAAIPDGALLNLYIAAAATAAANTYTVGISNVVASDASGSPLPLTSVDGQVTLQAGSGPPVQLQPQGVLNAASLAQGPVAPGEVVTFLGTDLGPPVPTSKPEGMQVSFDGLPAPLLYAASNQVNSIVPFGIAGPTTHLVLQRLHQTRADLTLTVQPAMPGIFTLTGTGVGQGAILNQDYSTNSPDNPSDRGSVVEIYATGAGQMNPPPVDGQNVPVAGPWPLPLLPVTVQIGGLDAEVLYTGSAPGLISGLLQVNCRVPAAVTPGPTVPVQLMVGGSAASQPGITMAIR